MLVFCRRPVSGRQPVAVRLRAAVAGPVVAPVAARGRPGAHAGNGRDATGANDGAASRVRGPPQRGRPRARGRHLPGRLAVQSERAERQRHRQHGGQDVASDRVPGPFAGRVLPGHRVVQRLLSDRKTPSFREPVGFPAPPPRVSLLPSRQSGRPRCHRDPLRTQ